MCSFSSPGSARAVLYCEELIALLPPVGWDDHAEPPSVLSKVVSAVRNYLSPFFFYVMIHDTPKCSFTN